MAKINWVRTLTKLNKTMTDAYIAKKVGSSQSTINRLRRGDIKKVDIVMANAILRLLPEDKEQ